MFKFEDNKCYQMPAHFGGWVYDPRQELYYHDTVCLNYTYATDGKRLADFLPEGFELLRPELMIGYVQGREINWMAGSSYNLIEVNVPVRFQGKRDQLEGVFALVVWENKTEPILGGREQTGIPKIYAAIEDLHIIEQNYYTNASFEGNTFLSLELTEAQQVEGQELAQIKTLAADRNLFGWRYIPKVGGPGAELSQPILYPQKSEIKSAWRGCAAVQWTQLKPQQNPSQCHIIKALAELPILHPAPVIMSKAVTILKPAQARVLE